MQAEKGTYVDIRQLMDRGIRQQYIDNDEAWEV